MNITAMTDEQVYLFDLNGYIVLKNVVDPNWIDAANRELDRLESMHPDDYPDPLVLGDPKTDSNLYISNILEAGPALVPFVDVPEVLGVIQRVTGGGYRLNHTYVIYRWGDGHTTLHGGGTPMRSNCQYRCENGDMFSPLTKAVFPMLPCGPEDGCFAAIAGSHKSNFARPWGKHPEENPPLRPILAEPGDAIVFTEGLAHGSTVNVSGNPRRTLYYCYSVNWMPDWGSQGLHYSDRISELLTNKQMDLLALANGSSRAGA
jgi:hypothetical protein